MQFKDERIQSVCTNQSNWLPDFLVGPVDEIFPGGVAASRRRTFGKRKHTWRLIAQAARDLPSNVVIQAIKRFLVTRPDFLTVFELHRSNEDTDGILKSLEEGKENVTFRVAGVLAVCDLALLGWWRLRVLRQREAVVGHLPVGSDLLGDAHGPLAEYFPSVLGGTPMISYNRAPFWSFGLGNQTTPMLLENAERSAAALNALCDDPDTSLGLGGMVSVFWVANSERYITPGFGGLVEAPDSLTVRDFLKSPWGGIGRDLPDGKFYAAILKKTKGRFSIRSWHETSLPSAEAHLRLWFSVLESLPMASGYPPVPCKVSDLAKCTVQAGKKSKPPSATYSELFEAALFGRQLPSRLYTAALERQSVELAKGCDKKTRTDFEKRLRARTTLIILYCKLKPDKKGDPITMENHTKQVDAAYLCGRLLAMLDKIHIEAHAMTIERNGKKIKVAGTNTSPATRSYASASTTPALAFPQLCKLARYHLGKIGGGWARYLEHGYEADTGEFVEGLKQIVDSLRRARVKEVASCDFPRTLSLDEQGSFAIGFYYERCRQWPKSKNGETNSVNENPEPNSDTQE